LLVNRIELGGGFTATRAAAGSMRREESSRRGLLAALGRDRLELLLGRLVLTPAIRAHRLVVGIVCSELVGCRARGRRPPFERRARRLCPARLLLGNLSSLFVFRSRGRDFCWDGLRGRLGQRNDGDGFICFAHAALGHVYVVRIARLGAQEQDRKSTRLNSSHVKIS